MYNNSSIPSVTTSGQTLTRLNPATTHHLERIIKKFKIKKILEIGSYVGMGSTQVFLRNCDEVTCIEDFSAGRNFELEIDGVKKTYTMSELFNLVTKNSDKLKLIEKSSLEAHKFIKNGEFDAVFIDGSHFYPDVLKDIKNYYYKIKKNGLVIGDDCQGYLSDFPKELIINNISNDNTIDLKNFKYAQIHPGPILACNDLLKSIVFDKNKIYDRNEADLGYSWIYYYQRSLISDLNFNFRKILLKIKLLNKKNFRKKFITVSDI